MAITVQTSGPFFDGAAEASITRACNEIEDQVAAQASANVHTLMNQFFRHPTPYYETQVTMQRAGQSTVVHDRGIAYGPWLEGVGQRNQTTRFKGYHHWRMATQQTEGRASDLAETVLRRHEGEWN